MPRASAAIMLFLICLNATATAWAASGVADDWGVEPAVGGDNFINNIKQETVEFGAGFGQASFMVGLFVNMALLFLSIAEFVFAAPIMFQNLGVPGWITTWAFAPMYLIVLLDGIYMYVGRDL